MSRKWMSCLCVVVLPLLAIQALADGVMLDGFSPRAVGRGGANIAFADNGAILLDNPAGAVNVEGNGLAELGVDALISHFNYSSPSTRPDTHTEFTPLPQISLIKRSADGQWAWGVGVFAPAGFSERFNLDGPFPLLGPRQYESFGALAKILPAVACRLTDRLSVGATLGVGISYAELEGPYFLQSPTPVQGLPMMLHLHGAGAAMVWSVGAQYRVTDATTVGVTYQSESSFHLHGTADIDAFGLGHSNYDTQIAVTWPRSVGLGVRHALCCHRTISADVIWYNWSTAFDEFGISLNRPSTPGFPPLTEQFPLHWQDTVSVRVGFEQILDGGQTVRLGYVYHRDPVPDETLTPYIQAILEHSFTVGYGWKWRAWDIDLAYLYSFSPTEHVASSDWIGGGFDGSVHRAQVHAICAGLTRRF